jgi:protein-S-isoprenylcysteine O-methyltransferase Ste14
MERQMQNSNTPESRQTKKPRYVPLWQAFPLAIFVWVVLPGAIALLTPHLGWESGRPGAWNLVGLVPVLIGLTGLFWGMLAHSAPSPGKIAWEEDKSYLLTRGMYAWSRNPMYVAELILLAGWVIFYSSAALMVFFAAWFAFFHYLVRSEERILEARFGESYRQYKARVPRWFGKPRR